MEERIHKMKLNKFFSRDTINSKQESYKYVANTLVDIFQKEKKKVFSFTSSSINQDVTLKIVKNLGNIINKKGIKTLVVDARISESDKSPLELSRAESKLLLSFNNLESVKLKEIIIENQEKYDLILVVVPSIRLRADALEYVKICKEIILIEKCMYCHYSDYEETLLYLTNSRIKPKGVITVI